MPVYSIQTPSGRVIDIEADTQEIAVRGAQEWEMENPMQQRPAAAQPPVAPNPNRSALGLVDDFVRHTANELTFGFADKLAAKGNEVLGRGAYDENIKQERAQTKQGIANIGVPAEIAGSLIGGVGGGLALGAVGASPLALAGPGMMSRIGMGAWEGAMQGGLRTLGESDTPVSPNQFAQDITTGGAIGAAVPVLGAAARRVITPFSKQLEAPAAKSAEVLMREGVELTPAQATGSKVARIAEDFLEAVPGSGGSPRLTKQPAQVSEALFRKAGGEGLPTADDRLAKMGELKQVFDDVYGRHFVMYGKSYEKDLDKAIRSYGGGKGFESAKQKVIEDVIEDLNSLRGRVLTGEDYQLMRTKINRITDNYTNDPMTGGALSRLRDVLDEQAERSVKAVSKTDWDLLQKTNRQYAVLKTLNRAADASPAGAEGIITPQAVKTANRAAIGREAQSLNKGELSELVNAATSILGQPAGPASSRSFVSRALGTGGVLGLGTLGAYTGSEYGLASGVASVAAPVTTGLLYFSPIGQRYLRNRVMPGAAIPASIQQSLTGGLIGLRTPQEEEQQQ